MAMVQWLPIKGGGWADGRRHNNDHHHHDQRPALYDYQSRETKKCAKNRTLEIFAGQFVLLQKFGDGLSIKFHFRLICSVSSLSAPG